MLLGETVMVRNEDFVRRALNGQVTDGEIIREGKRLRFLRNRRGLDGLIKAASETLS